MVVEKFSCGKEEENHNMKMQPTRKKRDKRHLRHFFFFPNSLQSSFPFLFLPHVIINWAHCPYCLTYSIHSLFAHPNSLFFIAISNLRVEGGILILIFLIISRGANIHFRIAAHINSPPLYCVYPCPCAFSLSLLQF